MQKKLEPFQFDFFHLFMDSDSHFKRKLSEKRCQMVDSESEFLIFI